jgi:biopolymer transport protein ExbB/TolQ
LAPLLSLNILAAGGLLYAFEQSTIAGKAVLAALLIGSIFSWSVMITKMRVVRFARQQTARFRGAFRKDRQPLRLFESNKQFTGSPLFNVYRAGCQEMTFHLLGSSEVTRHFARGSRARRRSRRRKWARSTPRWNAPSARRRSVSNRK